MFLLAIGLITKFKGAHFLFFSKTSHGNCRDQEQKYPGHKEEEIAQICKPCGKDVESIGENPEKQAAEGQKNDQDQIPNCSVEESV